MNNKHIIDFLSFYSRLEQAPEYAVLLKGKWGAGKTWLIDKFIKDNTDIKFLYISLYGLSSTEQIDNEIFKELHPILSSKSVGLAGKIIKGAIKTTIKIDIDEHQANITSQIPDIKIPDYFKNTKNHILVFDDLERCNMRTVEVLGYINYFIEHQGHKAIIIANEEDILNNDNTNYPIAKEKVIGKTFEVNSEFFDSFNKTVDIIKNANLKNILDENKDKIQERHTESGYKNLRVLKRSLIDLERIHEALPSLITDNDNFMAVFVDLFFVFSFEINSGKWKSEDFNDFYQSYISHIIDSDRNEKENIFNVINKKYKNISYGDIILPGEMWYEIIGNGVFIKEKIIENIQKSRYIESSDTPSWHMLWNHFSLTDDEFDFYLNDINEKINKKEYSDINVILSIAGIYLRLVEHVDIGMTKDEVINLSKRYIDHLCLNEPESIINSYVDSTTSSHDGLGFQAKETVEFKDIFNYYLINKKTTTENDYPNKARSLLNSIKDDDGHKFQLQISQSASEQINYYKTPILKYMKEKDFVSQFMSSSPQVRQNICEALNERYSYNLYYCELIEEYDWIKNVVKLLEIEKNNYNRKNTAYQLNRYIEHFFKKFIASLEVYKNNQSNNI